MSKIVKIIKQSQPMGILDRIFKDKDGKIVIMQFPNVPLMTYIVSLLLGKAAEGSMQQFFTTLSFGALFVFAWLELFEGVNYFRRALGLGVIIFSIMNKTG